MATVPARTPDIGLSAALLSLGIPYMGMERGEDCMVFMFEASEATISQLNARYHAQSLQVDAFRLAQSIRRLKKELRLLSDACILPANQHVADS